MVKVIAKFKVISLMEFEGGSKTAKLQAISGPNGEDKVFTDYTPNGNIEISISSGKPAAEKFKPGKICYVTFDFED